MGLAFWSKKTGRGLNWNKGWAARFDGTNGVKHDTPGLNIAFGKVDANKAWSITLWMKSLTLASSQTMRQNIFNPTVSTQIEILYTYSNGVTRVNWLRLGYFTSGGTVWYYLPFTTKNIADMNWHCITWSYDGSGVDAGHKLMIDKVSYTLLKESGTFGGTASIGTAVVAMPLQSATYFQGYLCGAFLAVQSMSLADHSAFVDTGTVPDKTAMLFQLDESTGTVAYQSAEADWGENQNRPGAATYQNLKADTHYQGADVPTNNY